ncbi:MAG: exodeoxyribonuclease III [Myxococcales bacterium]|nr:exodeoxyribonuclease III [Myxococcales bacterium]
MSKLTIATFNVNGINKRLANLLEWLRREEPDVVCLQELKATDTQFPARALNELGYAAVWSGEALWNGVAILGKGVQPVLTRRALPGQEADSHARYLEAAVHGVLVAALYLPNGNPIRSPKFAYKLAWFDALIAHAGSLFALPHPVVLAGDFNVVPTDDDIYNPRSWKRNALLQSESRVRYARLLDQGWVDTVRARHPDERVYTFWDYFREHWKRNAGLRLDHLLLNAELAGALTDAGVHTWVRDRPNASDHAPTWITLDRSRAQVAARQSAKRSAPRGAKQRRPRPRVKPAAT